MRSNGWEATFQHSIMVMRERIKREEERKNFSCFYFETRVSWVSTRFLDKAFHRKSKRVQMGSLSPSSSSSLKIWNFITCSLIIKSSLTQPVAVYKTGWVVWEQFSCTSLTLRLTKKRESLSILFGSPTWSQVSFWQSQPLGRFIIIIISSTFDTDCFPLTWFLLIHHLKHHHVIPEQ